VQYFKVELWRNFTLWSLINFEASCALAFFWEKFRKSAYDELDCCFMGMFEQLDQNKRIRLDVTL
jgi:aminopeptidase C